MKTTSKTTLRSRINFDAGWKFHRGDCGKCPVITPITEWKVKNVGKDKPKDASMAAADYNDKKWQVLKPARDAFDKTPGYAWFRVELPAMPKPGRIAHFTSVSDAATVYLNGKELVYHEIWTDPFEAELDSAWNEKGKNVLAVLVQNWYGIGYIDAANVENTPEPVAKEGPAAAVFNDSTWRQLRLPHDYVVEEKFDGTIHESSHGYLPKAQGWYRKEFKMEAADKGKAIWIDFDGVFRNSRVWVNGNYLGRHRSGYTGFRFDVSKYLNYGGTNTVAVRVDARGHEGWFYEGGGIYRHVWLNKANQVHVKPWGVYIVSEPKAGKAVINIETTVTNGTDATSEITIVHVIKDKKGKQAAEIEGSAEIKPGKEAVIKSKAQFNSPLLWSPQTPDLYTVVTTVFAGGKAVDSVENNFGIRSIKYDADKGFLLNGKPVFLKGTCNHQDHAGVGAAITDSLFKYRVQRLKEMGSNAYRCAHNPPASELLDECDRQGMFVIDENRRLGDSAEVLSQAEAMVLRDRNHPSIIMWSICNEEKEQGTDLGAKRAKALKQVINRCDPSRPITAAMNGDWGRGITQVLDLEGFNYNIVQYDPFRDKFPKMPMFGSETGSTISTRGEYITDKVKGYVSAYDVNQMEWSHTAQEAWEPIAKRPHMFGTFIWTGFDYRGEPTPYGWPCISSHFGIIDTCGFPKDNYYYYQSIWKEEPILHLYPHWNWSGMEGREIDVCCFTNYDQVELFINDRPRGLKE
ncbi:MAG: beta galactosidase jelly roll domain-containing protein, partial [Spirochaetia bacterium]|nr:beta galactosidase jelly roll domain-containing protein [Spirochaetia bacterium]